MKFQWFKKLSHFLLSIFCSIFLPKSKLKKPKETIIWLQKAIRATKFLEENHCRNLSLKGCLPRQLKFEWKSMHFFFSISNFSTSAYCEIETCECRFFLSRVGTFFLWCLALSTQLSLKALRKNVARFLEAKVKPNKPTN